MSKQVFEVNGKTGFIELTTFDIKEGYDLYYTEDRVNKSNSITEARIIHAKPFSDFAQQSDPISPSIPRNQNHVRPFFVFL